MAINLRFSIDLNPTNNKAKAIFCEQYIVSNYPMKIMNVMIHC